MARGPFSAFGEAKKERPFWVGRCVVCVCAECHGVSNDVLNDVFLRCVFGRYDVICYACPTRKTFSAIFLMLMPWAAIFSMAKSSSEERTILVANEHAYKHLGFWDKMWLWCMDLVPWVGDVCRCEMSKKPAVLKHFFLRSAFFIKGRAQLKMLMSVLGPFLQKNAKKIKENRDPPTQKERITRGILAGDFFLEENGYSYEWRPVSDHFSSRMKENRM